MAGREDSGLTNEELDCCDVLVTISTDPAHPSLNLAQAVAIMAYESWLARGGDRLPFKRPRRTAPAAPHALLETLFADWTRALWAIDFFKTRQPANVMRSFREIVFRAGLDGREASLLRAMGIEVVPLHPRGRAAATNPRRRPSRGLRWTIRRVLGRESISNPRGATEAPRRRIATCRLRWGIAFASRAPASWPFVVSASRCGSWASLAWTWEYGIGSRSCAGSIRSDRRQRHLHADR